MIPRRRAACRQRFSHRDPVPRGISSERQNAPAKARGFPYIGIARINQSRVCRHRNGPLT
jgi:hypothetical protein